MAGNTFGNHFRVTTWGESHGPAIGAVIDGCPSGLKLSEKDLQIELNRRRSSAKNPLTTPRREPDLVKILSGVFQGKTTGLPIMALIQNKKHQSAHYEKIKDVYRPGHADLTYQLKYGFRDYRGGGRASGRETIGRVIAGAIAKKLLQRHKTEIIAYAIQVGPIKTNKRDLPEIKRNPLYCPDREKAVEMLTYALKKKKTGNSVGGIIEIIIKNPLAGLGEPVFDKLEAKLGQALLSIGGIKGIEFGQGFKVATLTGSQNNDTLIYRNKQIRSKKNLAGGILGGISTGENIIIHLAVKPTPSIAQTQKTVSQKGKAVNLKIQGQHDACLIPRIIPVTESMIAITLINLIFAQKNNR